MTAAARTVAALPPGEAAYSRTGDDFWASWPEHSTRFRFSAVHEDRGAIQAEFTAYIDVEGAPEPAEWTILTLSNRTARSQIATGLSEHREGPPYREMLLMASNWVAEQVRHGEPVKRLGQKYIPEPQRYALWPYLPLGVITSFYGEGGSGKSFLALYFLLLIQEGLERNGLRPTKLRVLYLDYECNWDEQQSRLMRVAQGMGLESYEDILYVECYRPLHDDLPAIRRLIDENNIDVVVVDSMSLASGGDPKEHKDVNRTMGALRSLRRTVLVLDHVTKSGDQGKAIGAQSKFDYSRSAIEAVREREPNGDGIQVGIFHRKANNGPLHQAMGFDLSFDGDEGPVIISRMDVRDTETLAQRVPLRDRILHAVSRGPLDLAALKELLPDVSEAALRRACYRMAEGTPRKPAILLQLGNRWGTAETRY